MKPSSKVQVVRQKGGDCIQQVKSKVSVIKEESPAKVFENSYDEQSQQVKYNEERAIAEERGKKAKELLAKESWLQEKIKKTELERREGVKLMEMLRRTKQISRSKIKTKQKDSNTIYSESNNDNKMTCSEFTHEDHRTANISSIDITRHDKVSCDRKMF